MNLTTTGIVIACVLLFQGQHNAPPPAAQASPSPVYEAGSGRGLAANITPPLAVKGQGGGIPVPAPVKPTPAASHQNALLAPRTGGAITIPVPVYMQTMNLDCETASLQMALAYRGHWYSQSYMFQFEHPDTRPAIKSADGTILQWGNPFTNFVGDVNGAEHTGTGYGVYYPPILWIANGLGDPSAVGGSGFSPSTIYQAVASGHPVQVWVEYQWVRPAVDVWKAWDNTKIHYSLHEHTVVLSGVSDTQVRVNDPWPGTQYWIDKSTFELSWHDFYNMAIIY